MATFVRSRMSLVGALVVVTAAHEHFADVESATMMQLVQMREETATVEWNGMVETATAEKLGDSLGSLGSLGWQDPNWFTTQKNSLQTIANALNNQIDACAEDVEDSTTAVDGARTSHQTCRVEQQQVSQSNVTQSCLEEKEKACGVAQTTFESVVCQHAANRKHLCSEYDTCHNAAVSARTAALADLQAQIGFLQAEFLSMKKFECRMQHWPLTAATAASCESLTVTGDLDPSIPAEPSKVTCEEFANKPGDDAWKQDEYDGKNWSSLVQNVTACAGGVGGAPPAVCDASSGLSDVMGWAKRYEFNTFHAGLTGISPPTAFDQDCRMTVNGGQLVFFKGVAGKGTNIAGMQCTLGSVPNEFHLGFVEIIDNNNPIAGLSRWGEGAEFAGAADTYVVDAGWTGRLYIYGPPDKTGDNVRVNTLYHLSSCRELPATLKFYYENDNFVVEQERPCSQSPKKQAIPLKRPDKQFRIFVNSVYGISQAHCSYIPM